MAFDVLEAEETEDHYVITLSFRPQGEFDGRAGREQFFIEKEGNVAHRQVLSLPRLRRRIPLITAVAGIALVAAIAIGVSIGVTRGGGGDGDTGVGSGSPTVTGVSAEGESSESPKEPQNDTPGSSVLEPLVSDAGLEYVPASYSGGLEIFAGQRVAMSFTVPADGAITGVELLNVGHEACRADAALDFRLMSTVDGHPGTPVILSVSIPPEDVDLEHSGVRIDLPEAWHVGAYQMLALELSTADDSTTGDNCYYGWNGENPGTYRGGQAFTSLDGGLTWLPDRKDLAFRVFFQPNFPAVLPGSTISPLVTRDLLSQPWHQGRRGDQPDQPWNEPITLLTVSGDHSTMYALNAEGCISNCLLYRSSDEGRNWWPIVLPFSWSATLAIRSVDAREIYAWSGTMMWRSLDGGNQWTELDTPAGIVNPGVPAYIRAVSVSPDILYMATADQNYENGGFFQSQDKGENWRLFRGWSPGITHLSVASDQAIMYVAWRTSNGHGLQWSRDGGLTWDGPRYPPKDDIVKLRVTDFTIDFSESSILYAAVAGTGLLRIGALNPGEYPVLWSSDTAESEVQSIAVHPSNSDVLAIRTTKGLSVTSDAERRGFRFTKRDIRYQTFSTRDFPRASTGQL